MTALFKRLLLSSSAFVAASDLVKRAKPSRFASKGLLFCLIVFFPTALVAVLSTSEHADATEAIIGLSHAGDPAQIKALIVRRALNAAPGDKITIDDATGKEITSITISTDPAKARLQGKAEAIAPAMAVLNRYLSATPAAGSDNLGATSFLDAIGPKVTELGPGVRILLVLSPWFNAPGVFSKPEYIGGFPSDGLILSDHLHSPFGGRGEHDLQDATVDYCYITDASSGFINGDQTERVQRAWSLSIQQRGGKLTSFTSDIRGCFDRFSEEKPPEGRQFAFDPKDSTMLLFYKVKEAGVRIVDAPPVVAGPPGVVVTATERRTEAARFDKPSRTTPPSTKTGTAWFGIQWQEKAVDLDLYVRCEPSAPLLFFANGRSREGRHNGDWRVGTGKEFESVDLTSPCTDISKAEVYVNFFSGSVQEPPKGVFAIEFDGGTYKTDFEIPARSGNGARDYNPAGGMGAPYWVKMNLASVLHLNGSVAAVRPRTRSTK